MNPTNAKSIAKLSDRIFYWTLLLHTLALSLLFGVFMLVSIQRNNSKALQQSVALFREWEARLTEQVFVRQVVDSSLEVPSIPLLELFEKELASQGIEAKVKLMRRAEAKGNALVFYPLTIGNRPLEYVIAISLVRTYLSTPVILFLIAGAVTIIVFMLTWSGLKLRLRKQIVYPLIKQIEKDSGDIAFNKVASQVAHDIRSPLQALLMLADSDSIPTNHSDLLRKVTTRIKDIADELLDNRRSNVAEGISLLNLVSSVVEEKQVELQSMKISIQVINQLSNPMSEFNLNRIQFERILSNLLNNAAEATDGKGTIDVVLRNISPSLVQITISDKGKGIPESILSDLNSGQMFTSKVNGNGLGLCHAREWLREFKGDIKIESRVRVGTSVHITLPLTS